jgi:glycosyltransferase involved in cell wall biosynthesis
MTRHPPDVLFVPAHVLPIRHPHRSVVTIHDLGYEQFPEAHTAAQRRYLRLSTRWSARAATALIVPSAATAADLVRLYAVPRAKIHVVPHGLSPRFRPEPDPQRIAAAQARYGISGPYFFSLGTVQPRKNLARLLEAFAQIGGSPQLVIAGKRGWLSEPIERRARELGLEDRVRFAGYVADEDAPALLTGALAFLFPSLYEGFGMPLLEAMACGAPVLASGTSSLPEVADGAALLVNPTDTSAIAAAIARLASDGDLRAMLRKRGLARAAAFSWDHCARQTLDVLLG